MEPNELQELAMKLNRLFHIFPYRGFVNFATNEKDTIYAFIETKQKQMEITAYLNNIKKDYPDIKFEIKPTGKVTMIGEY